MANSNQGGERSMWDRINPIPRIQALGRNIRAHPFQTALGFAANAALPGAGPALMQAFKPFNNWRDSNRAQNFNRNIGLPQIQGVNNRLSQQLMGGLSSGNPLADAMMAYGGQNALNSGQYNMSAQQQPNGYDAIMSSVPSAGVGGLNLSGLDAALAARGGGLSPGFGMSGNNGTGFGTSAMGTTFGGAPISAMQSIRSGTAMSGAGLSNSNQPGMRGKVKQQA